MNFLRRLDITQLQSQVCQEQCAFVFVNKIRVVCRNVEGEQLLTAGALGPRGEGYRASELQQCEPTYSLLALNDTAFLGDASLCALILQFQIGRAPRRERVCQYV